MRGATIVGLGGMAAHLVIKADGQIVRQLGPEKCVNGRLGAVASRFARSARPSAWSRRRGTGGQRLCLVRRRLHLPGVLAYKPYEKHSIDTELCTRCDIRQKICQDESINVV